MSTATHQEKWFQVVLPRDSFALAVDSVEWDGESALVVTKVAPTALWMMGIDIQDIKIWIRQNGGSIEELRDTQARLVV